MNEPIQIPENQPSDTPAVAQSILVVGTGIAGAASAEALLATGRTVTVYDAKDTPAAKRLAAAGVTVHTGDWNDAYLDNIDEVVISPGIPPHHPIPTAALARTIPVYSEPELAWRLRRDKAPQWFAVTGTNGKTTVTTMAAHILDVAGWNTAALGNIGKALVTEANGPYDALVVELSSYQLHWSSTIEPLAGVLLNLADDHLNWHGTFDAYAHEKTKIWNGKIAVINRDDPKVAALFEAKKDQLGHVFGFTLHEPHTGDFGYHDGNLIDNTTGEPHIIMSAKDLTTTGDHNIANALAACALVRIVGISAEDMAKALRTYAGEPHRNATVLTHDEITWVDDSKATNPHAAAAALGAYDSIVWVAGGQLKGVDVSQLVATYGRKLRAAILIGADRQKIANALRILDAKLPIVLIDESDPVAAMDAVAVSAVQYAQKGDTVLLSPAAASLDMYSSYADRGMQFSASVRKELNV